MSEASFDKTRVLMKLELIEFWGTSALCRVSEKLDIWKNVRYMKETVLKTMSRTHCEKMGPRLVKKVDFFHGIWRPLECDTESGMFFQIRTDLTLNLFFRWLMHGCVTRHMYVTCVMCSSPSCSMKKVRFSTEKCLVFCNGNSFRKIDTAFRFPKGNFKWALFANEYTTSFPVMFELF